MMATTTMAMMRPVDIAIPPSGVRLGVAVKASRSRARGQTVGCPDARPALIRPAGPLRALRRLAAGRGGRRARGRGGRGAVRADGPRHRRRRARGGRARPRARPALLRRRRALGRARRPRGPARPRLRARRLRPRPDRDPRGLPRRPRAPDRGRWPTACASSASSSTTPRSSPAARPASRSAARTSPTPCSRTPPTRERLRATRGSPARTSCSRPTSCPGAKAYVARSRPTVAEAIEVIHAAGGVAVWAHPFWDVDAPEEALAHARRVRRRGARRGRVLLRHPHRGADPPAARARASARAADDRLDGLPRPRSRPIFRVSRLRGSRSDRRVGSDRRGFGVTAASMSRRELIVSGPAGDPLVAEQMQALRADPDGADERELERHRARGAAPSRSS